MRDGYDWLQTPEQIMTSRDLEMILNTSDDWIFRIEFIFLLLINVNHFSQLQIRFMSETR